MGGALGCLVLLLAIVVLGVIWRRYDTKWGDLSENLPRRTVNFDSGKSRILYVFIPFRYFL